LSDQDRDVARGGTLRIAIDIGGTFTDGVLEEGEGGRIWVGKTLTTYSDPGVAISRLVQELLQQAREHAGAEAQVAEIVHGTTLVTNTLIERDGVPTAMVVSSGTRDVLDIGREMRYDLYDLDLRMPQPLVGTDARFEIDARIAADGAVIRELDPAAVDSLAQDIRHAGAASVAICLLHSYADDRHERELAHQLRQRLPGVSFSISSAITREAREYERMSTVAANAYVQPLVEGYLGGLEGRLRDLRIQAPLRIMVSSGGFTSTAAAARAPILLLESGPAGGVLSAVNTGIQCTAGDILAFDMGGTTAKACVASNGKPAVAHMFEAARVNRFKRGSGLPLMIPSIDLIEIGAGGGSIAQVNNLGLLTVGPESAASEPGPACYGLGGTDPTVTDAALLLGYLDPERFLGGAMQLSRSHAAAAMEKLAVQLQTSGEEVAWRIYNVVNENMAGSARVHVAEKGFDPQSLTLVATGGAGPLHAVEVARKLGIKRVLVPIAAGAGSCLGFLAAPMRVDRAYTRASALAHVNWAELASRLDAIRSDAGDELASLGRPTHVQWRLNVEMRYAGQGFTLAVERPDGVPGPSWERELLQDFERRYRAIYGQLVPNGVAEVVTWRLTGASDTVGRRFVLGRSPTSGVGTAGEERPVFLTRERRLGVARVYDRYSLPAGGTLHGPAIIEERETTIAVPIAATIRVLDDLTLSIELEEGR